MLVNSLLKQLGLLIFAILTSCSIPRSPQVDLLPASLKGPYGGEMEVFNTAEIEIPNQLSAVIIGEGNGKVGYQSIKISSNNKIEIRLIEKDNTHLVGVYTSLLKDEDFTVFSMTLVPQLEGLKKGYTTPVSGGSTAFLILEGKKGQSDRIYMSNYFPAEVEKIWHKMIESVRKISPKNWEFVTDEEL